MSRIVKQPIGFRVADVISINKQTLPAIEVVPIQIPSDDVDQIAQIRAQKIIHEAQSKAVGLIDDARIKAQVIIQDAEQKRHIHFENGCIEGKREAHEKVLAMMDELAMVHQHQLDEIVKCITSTHLLAVEIASVIIKQKIESDLSVSMEMILKTIESHNALNVQSIEISDLQTHLIRLVQEYGDVELKAAPSGHLVIKTDAGWIDCSVETQLNNVRRHFQML